MACPISSRLLLCALASLREIALYSLARVADVAARDPAFQKVAELLPWLKQWHNEMDPVHRAGRARDYLFERGGLRVPFHALSDGYLAFIGWAADLLCGQSTRSPTRPRCGSGRSW